jgi:LPXTG-motif cell wall-anchored protein
MADMDTHTTDFRPIFLRFGDNKWVLTTIDKVIAADGAAYVMGYALDAVSVGDIGNGLNNHTTGALVLGNMNADGTIDTTGFDVVFGLTAGDIDLGSFGADLYTPSAKTGDASPIVAIVVAALFSVGAIGFIASKKKEF